MEDFIKDEIDMMLKSMFDEEVNLTDEQYKTIYDNIVNGYDYIWEDLNSAIIGEIQNVLN